VAISRFAHNKYHFGLLVLENKSPEGSERKTFKIENGTIADKAVYQGDVKLTTPLYLLLSITFFLPK
jgi:hypothetical protein